MNAAGTIASRWAVSTRTRGDVQIAGAAAGTVELVLLGVPAGFTSAEVESWLHDLAGVALETSRDDVRARAIPALLHHALSGLLFSQAELWSGVEPPGPCSAVFCDAGDATAFGWLGEAEVRVSVGGVAMTPTWVMVRDEHGREARGLALPVDRPVRVELEYWPAGPDEGEAPSLIEAEWQLEAHVEPVAPPADSAPAPVAGSEPPAEAAALGAQALPATLPVQQPGLSGAARSDAPTASATASEPASAAASAEHPHQSDEAPAPPGEARVANDDGPAAAPLSVAQVEALEELGEVRQPHPVARWLGKMLHIGRRPGRQRRVVDDEPEQGGAPVSAYDALLSERVPPTPLEQTTLVLSEPAGIETQEPAPDSVQEPAAVTPALPDPEQAPAHELEAVAPPEDQPVPAASEAIAAPAVAPEPAHAEPSATAPEPPASPAPAPEPALPIVAPELRPSAPALSAPGARAEALPPGVSAESSPPSAHARSLAELTAADASALPVLPVLPVLSGPRLEPGAAATLPIDREPVGAAEGFAIPRLPSRAAPPAAPPVLRVAIASAPPRLEPQGQPPLAPVSPGAPEALAPRSLEAPTGPPVLRVPAAPPPAGPPVLRVQLPGRGTEAPPMLRVTPTAVPPPAIVPTRPVAPVVSEPAAFAPAVSEPAAFAPAEAPSLSPTPRAWPSHAAPQEPRRLPRRAWGWGGVVLGVFLVGWLLGVLANPDHDGPGPLTRALRAVGLGPAHFDASVNSSPNGAWIAVDGKELDKRTPATIELAPGTHTLTLSLPDLGSAQVPVNGRAGGRVELNPSLGGALTIDAADPSVPIRVALDGKALGYAPLQLESVSPGLHELQFTGPGMPAWGQTVQVGVRRTVQVVAHPMSAPSNGVIQVTATLNDERGASPLRGAQVWVDGELRASTPASLDLPRGPHSLRVVWKDENAPVQVIDLPGGNQRFATFGFGLETAAPQITLLAGVHPATRQQTAVVSASLQGLAAGDVQEAWLHSRLPEGSWRRDAMTVMPGNGGPVVVGVFPPQAFDAQGQSRWYVSLTTRQGDELFSEMQPASVGGAAAPRRRAAALPDPAPH